MNFDSSVHRSPVYMPSGYRYTNLNFNWTEITCFINWNDDDDNDSDDDDSFVSDQKDLSLQLLETRMMSLKQRQESNKPCLCPAYSLTEIQGYFINNILCCLLNFCRLRHLLKFFGFCVYFSRIYLQVREDFFDSRDVGSIQTADNCIPVSWNILVARFS